jgi:hypothetical protein
MNTAAITRSGITVGYIVTRDGETIGRISVTATDRFRASRVRGAVGNVNRTGNNFRTVQAAAEWIGEAA